MMLGSMATGFAAGVLGSSLFKDVKADSPYDAAIGEMAQLSIMKGITSTQFRPNAPVKRGELAGILKNFRDSLKGIEVSAGSSSTTIITSTSSSSSSSSMNSYPYNPAGYIRFTTTAYSVNEALGTIAIPIVRTGGNQGTVAVDYELQEGTAVAGTDYTDSKGTVTFANKETSKKINIGIKDDGQSKAERTFTIILKNPQYSAGISAPDRATVKILDRFATSSSSSTATAAASSSSATTPTFSLSASAYGAAENDGSLTVTVLRGGVTSNAASVNYATSNGTAGGGEHSPVNGKLDFAAGETSKSFTVAIPDDTSYDGSKTVNIILSNPTNGAVLVTPSNAIFTIYDNEAATFGSGSLKLSKTNYEVSEAAGKATVTVMRVGGTRGTATIGYAATGGSATEGTDYVGVAGTLTFAPGESSKIFIVPVMKDSTADAGETIGLTLSNPSGALLSDPSSGIITIQQ